MEAEGQAATFDVQSVIGEGGAFAEGWKDHLPADAKEAIGDSKYFDNIKDLPSLIKSTAGLSKLAGRALIPGDDAPDEEWDKVYGRGVPEKAEDYALGIADVEDERIRGIIENSGILATIQKELHAAGVPKRLASRIATQRIQTAIGKMEDHFSRVDQGTAKLKEEWGNSYQANINASQDAMKRFGGDELTKVLSELGVQDHPAIVRHFYEVSRRVQPGKVVSGQSGRKTAGRSDTPLVNALGLGG